MDEVGQEVSILVEGIGQGTGLVQCVGPQGVNQDWAVVNAGACAVQVRP